MPKLDGNAIVRRPYPTARGIALFSVGVVGLVTGVGFGRTDFLFVGIVLVTSSLTAMILVAFERPNLVVTRSVDPAVVAAGESTTISLVVRNHALRPSPASTWRDLSSGAISVRGLAPFPRLAERRVGLEGGNDTVRLAQRVRATVRGSHDVGPLVIGRSDPFRIARTEFTVGGQRQILVTPRVTRLSRGVLDVARSEGSEHELLSHSIPSADELIAREYRAGDPLRRVHWRATARHDKLMVRQEEQRSNPESWIIFDTVLSGDVAPPLGAAPANPVFESAVELLASIGLHLLEEGFDVSVVETGIRQLTGSSFGGGTGGRGSMTPRFGAGSESSFLTDLAMIEQTDRRNDESIAEAAAGLRRLGRAVPLFAIICDDRSGADALAELRSLAEPSVAFVADILPSSVAMTLGEAGWNCVEFSQTSNPADVWQIALAQQAAMIRG